MAEIWPVYEGKEPTYGPPWASMPLAQAATLFEIDPDKNFLKPHSDAAPHGPRFGDQARNMRYAGYRHVVVEVSQEEARSTNWRSGYYLSPVSPKEAYRRLLEQPIAAELGPQNVVRLEFEPANDADGQEILKIVVVVTPAAVRRLKGVRLIGALTKLRERLLDLGEERAPIVQYATEQEFRQLAGH